MKGVLESTEWGCSTLKLLHHLQEINFDIPTALYIRHSERPRILDLNDSKILLNQRGEKAAYEFGKRLPRDCSYRLHHTYYDRTRETAEEIVRGVKGSGGGGRNGWNIRSEDYP